MIVNLYGASGSGKTTLIREAIRSNVLKMWLASIGVHTGLNEQKFAMTTIPLPKFRGEVGSYLELFGIKNTDIENASPELIRLFKTIFPLDEGCNHWETRTADSLSAGEGRRLSILRCLLESAEICIVDEPFANSHRDIDELILDAINTKSLAILLTHDKLKNSDDLTIDCLYVSVKEGRDALMAVLNDK